MSDDEPVEPGPEPIESTSPAGDVDAAAEPVPQEAAPPGPIPPNPAPPDPEPPNPTPPDPTPDPVPPVPGPMPPEPPPDSVPPVPPQPAPPELDVPALKTALEAVLMVVDEPIPTVSLAQVLETPRADVDAALRELSTEYTEHGRGFDLREVAGGWRFYSRPECAPVVERFVLDGQHARLTQAALETLAVVAYRQPVSRARISAIRGVNCDGVVRTLVSRGLIEEAGSEDSGALLYRTTILFLERLGLQSVDDLPEIAPYLPEMDDLTDTEDVAS